MALDTVAEIKMENQNRQIIFEDFYYQIMDSKVIFNYVDKYEASGSMCCEFDIKDYEEALANFAQTNKMDLKGEGTLKHYSSNGEGDLTLSNKGNSINFSSSSLLESKALVA